MNQTPSKSWSSTRRLTLCLSLVVVAVVAGLLTERRPANAATQENAKQDATAKPVDNMHHFMEYVYEPAYKRLREQLGSEPADRNAWKGVKGDSLTIAEAANLLLARAPEEDAEDWLMMSVEIRDLGSAVYQAARKSDYETAKSKYSEMIQSCNACHQQFADGKYQLKAF